MGPWEELRRITDPQLQPLVQDLQSTVMKSRADSTVTKYTRAFLRWKQWADTKDSIEAFPVRPAFCSLFATLGVTISV